jgi:hypothetical protein
MKKEEDFEGNSDTSANQTNSSFSDTNSSNSSLSLKGYSTQTGSTTYFGTLEYTPPEFF